MKNVLNFINKNKEIYFNFLMELDGFPNICDYSSEILGAYLNSKFNTNLMLCSGNYDSSEDLCHNWLEVDENIIDFTLLQFTIPSSTIEEAIKEGTLLGLVNKSIPFPIINNNNEWRSKYDFLEDFYIEDELVQIANKSNNFKEYLEDIKLLYRF